MKKLLLVIGLLWAGACWGQKLKDTIITSASDTIACKITHIDRFGFHCKLSSKERITVKQEQITAFYTEDRWSQIRDVGTTDTVRTIEELNKDHKKRYEKSLEEGYLNRIDSILPNGTRTADSTIKEGFFLTYEDYINNKITYVGKNKPMHFTFQCKWLKFEKDGEISKYDIIHTEMWGVRLNLDNSWKDFRFLPTFGFSQNSNLPKEIPAKKFIQVRAAGPICVYSYFYGKTKPGSVSTSIVPSASGNSSYGGYTHNTEYGSGGSAGLGARIFLSQEPNGVGIQLTTNNIREKMAYLLKSEKDLIEQMSYSKSLTEKEIVRYIKEFNRRQALKQE